MLEELRKFVVPEIIIGQDSRLLVGRYLSHFNAKKPLLVTDAHVRTLPWFQDIVKEIENYTPYCLIFDEVTENPKDYEAMLGAEVFLSGDCDLVIAVGGGSPMDCAKAIAIVATNGGHILDYEGVDEVKLPGPPLICIPSTAGTGADVSQFAIIADSNSLIKKAIISKKVVPDLALIDPVPLMTMSPELTAFTGMDALTHAVEAYVSNAQSPLTDINALEAVRLIYTHLPFAVREDRTLDTMYQMMLASLYAGMAFSNASLGTVHAMAHSLGGLLDLPHGACNSILLEHVVDYNYKAAPSRYGKLASCFGVSPHLAEEEMKEALLAALRNFRKNLGIPDSFTIQQNLEESIEALTSNAMLDPCNLTNPRELSESEVGEIYGRILQKK